ncbi:A mating type protein [Serpula lacrymans var. lacrymans S7.9]|uniref:A mating type protein n=1 Tax=Serpula lacrymans var. lacrymans (strain S7.9) TaxID=578457 RepID=F8NG88_SERL9|nr:A mating type protein [Serpula lacrymans var. lacrymans S7.9]EGO31058.1 A mating type protein [Serpula lacrymans var. lacrymans S7.9]
MPDLTRLSENSGNSERETILRSIIGVAAEIKRTTAPPASDPLTCSPTTRLSTDKPPILHTNLELPTPQSILCELSYFNPPAGVSQRLDDLFLRKARELQFQTQASMRQTLMKVHLSSGLSEELSFTIFHTFRSTYFQKQSDWKKMILASLKSSHKCSVGVDSTHITKESKKLDDFSSTRNARVRHKFNQEYVPMLELFFRQNPFPSHADKAFLAKKSGMTYRQMHVWFQNRRSRTKKEGLEVKRRPESPVSRVYLDELCERMRERIIPECERMSTPDSDTTDSEVEHEARDANRPRNRYLSDVLDVCAPPHAFPSAYPPSCDYNPFPAQGVPYQFSIPQWRRRPTQKLLRPPQTIDFDEIIEMFSRMNMKCGAEKARKHRAHELLRLGGGTTDLHIHRQPTAKRLAATSSITVKPPPAPLPSLIRSTKSYLPVLLPSLISVPAPNSRLHVFNTPSPQSRPTTLVPVPGTETTTRKVTSARKIAPLPKRIPKGTSIAHRGITPAMSESSVIPSLSLTSPSRTSSYGSSETRLFSESSSSSSSPRVRTPATSSNSLPRIVTPTLSMPGLSPYQQSSSMSDLFADSPVGTPSQAESLQLDMNFFGDPHVAKASDFNFFGIPPSTNLVHAQS